MIWRRAYVWRWPDAEGGNKWAASKLFDSRDPGSRYLRRFRSWQAAICWAMEPVAQGWPYAPPPKRKTIMKKLKRICWRLCFTASLALSALLVISAQTPTTCPAGLYPTIVNGNVLQMVACKNGQPTIAWTSPQYSDAEVPAGTLDGVNKTFTLARIPATLVIVTLNGLVQKAGADFTSAGASVSFVQAPEAGARLQCWYRY